MNKFVITAEILGKRNKVYYCIDINSGGYPYLSDYFAHAVFFHTFEEANSIVEEIISGQWKNYFASLISISIEQISLVEKFCHTFPKQKTTKTNNIDKYHILELYLGLTLTWQNRGLREFEKFVRGDCYGINY